MKNNYFSKSNKPKANTAPFGLQLPIQLAQENGSNLWTWYFRGLQMRNHFVSGFWYSEDGRYVFWGWQDLPTHTLTSLKTVDIHADDNGRQYVEVKRQGEQSWKQYLDEAVCTCFHGKPKPGQFANHKDGNHSNCEADNLVWIYPSDISA